MKLYEQAQAVNSKETFLKFLEALKDDRLDEIANERFVKSSPYGPGANGWQNQSIEMFLDAMHSFGEDSHLVGEQSSWQTFAWLLLAGKEYE